MDRLETAEAGPPPSPPPAQRLLLIPVVGPTMNSTPVVGCSTGLAPVPWTAVLRETAFSTSSGTLSSCPGSPKLRGRRCQLCQGQSVLCCSTHQQSSTPGRTPSAATASASPLRAPRWPSKKRASKQTPKKRKEKKSLNLLFGHATLPRSTCLSAQRSRQTSTTQSVTVTFVAAGATWASGVTKGSVLFASIGRMRKEDCKISPRSEIECQLSGRSGQC